MPPTLLPCPCCRRHVRSTETACPFCGDALADLANARVVPDLPRRMSRAEMFAFAAVFLGACQTSTAPPDASHPEDAVVVRVTDAEPVVAEDVASPAADSGSPSAADASLPPCDGSAPDAGLRRRARRVARPRMPPTTVQPCYGLPFGD